MDFFENIEGNERVKSLLRTQAQAGRLSHAYLIEGVSGSGRKSLAYAALATLAGGEDGQRIMRGICPDVHIVRPAEGKVTILVDQIRQLREQAWLRPSELDFRAFIIEDAQRMNESAQNALLKMLEEPPEGVYFFLTCLSGAKLLPTVLSRVQLLRTEILPHEVISSAVKKLTPRAAMTEKNKPEEYAKLLSSSQSIGYMLDVLEGVKKAIPDGHPTVLATLDALRSGNKASIIDLFPKIPDDREGYYAYLEALTLAFRDLIVCKKGGGVLLFFESAGEAEEYMFAFSEKKCADCLRLVQDAVVQNEAYVNLKLAKTGLLDGLWG